MTWALFLQVGSVVLLVLGFGFVVFFHELGHFLAAKAVGIKVEQFAIGFGPAICSWRRGLGLRWGSSTKEYEAATKSAPAGAAPAISETEYRVNWVPLGGYVKMLGQDDLKPGATADDPRAFNRKSIRQRMVVVSAGVIMNVLLAMILFTALFLHGFNSPPAIVGNVITDSPAQLATNAEGKPAPLRVGDRILYYDDGYQHDFTKISLNVALSAENTPVMAYVHRAGTPEGTGERIWVTPARMVAGRRNLLVLGINPPVELRGPEKTDVLDTDLRKPELLSQEDVNLLQPGDRIVKIGEESIRDPKTEFWKLDRALQASGGKPVPVTIEAADGTPRPAAIQPHFPTEGFKEPLNFAGMLPRVNILSIDPKSSARGKILPGDVVVSVNTGGDRLEHPTGEQFTDRVTQAGKDGRAIDVTVLRDGKEITIEGLHATISLKKGKAIGLGLGADEQHAVIAGVIPDSAAALTGIPGGSEIVSIGGTPVQNWFEAQTALASAAEGKPVEVVVRMPHSDQNRSYGLTFNVRQLALVHENHYVPSDHILFHEHTTKRQTNHPLVAAAWGVTETKDFILQFYLTIQRMFQGSVDVRNLMGPLGIARAGALFAIKGMDWLMWFLAMISANLAVVNFLPIPVVDGGLFAFLILEKIQGKPLSERVQSIAQVVGLALIVGVFLLVTYQDIVQWIRPW